MALTSSIFGKLLIPSVFYAAGDLRFYYYSKFKKNLKKSKEEIKQYQLSRLKALVKHCYETVPYYTKLFDELGIKPEQIQTLEDYAKLPILTKLNIRKNYYDMISKKKYKLEEGSSGGSTGNTVHFVKDKRYVQMSRAVWMRDLYSIGIKPGEKVAWIWGTPFSGKFSVNDTMHKFMWKLQRKILFNVKSFNEQELDVWLKNDFTKFQPNYIYGYPHLVYEVAKYIKKNNIILPPILKVVCTAERMEHRDFIEEVFGCKVYDQYGSREVLEIGIEDENYVMHSSDDFVLVENGQDNKIILTPLESYGMPLLRYEIGDVGTAKPASGKDTVSPFSELNIDIGRQCELLKDKDGNNVSFAAFCAILNRPVSVGEIQLVQKTLDKVELRIVPNEDMKQEHVDLLVNEIKEKLGCKKVIVKYLDKYPLAKSGKKITFVCELK